MSTALEGELSEDLAFINRNVQSSLEVLPGVVQGTTSRLQGGIMVAVNGGQAPEHAGYVDGVDTSFAKQGGATRIFLPITSLTEIKMDTVGFSAEYGRVVGGVTSSVIKSGTNQFHGDFLYIPQNEKWKAEYDELDIPRDDDIIDSFETSLGGPIVRDKAWFFASYGDMHTNEADVVGNGTPLDVGFETTASILKLNFQPTSRHQLQLTGVDAPMDKVNINQNFGDEFTPCDCNLDENLATLTWSYAITDSLFLETKVATQEDSTFREPLTLRVLTPGASPESPLGNHFRYQDQQSGRLYNWLGQGAGQGYIETARDQANASLNYFLGKHELKFGADYQDVASKTLNVIGTSFRGRGYNPNRPGGFAAPRDKRVFDPTSPVETTSEMLSAFAQDRFDVGDRFNLYVGVRMDDQAFDNDAGTTVHSSTDFAPRLAATYDFGGDGKMLLKATAGRYFQVAGQDSSTRITQPSRTAPTCSRSSSGTRRRSSYNGAQRRQNLPPGFNPGTFDPYYKDEVSLGLDWQFVPAWAFEVRGSMWEENDAYWITNQFNAAGLTGGRRPQLGRRVPGVRGSRARAQPGFPRQLDGPRQLRVGRDHRQPLRQQRGGAVPGHPVRRIGRPRGLHRRLLRRCDPAAPTPRSVNREGVGNTGREHILNIVGLKVFPIGQHSIGLGGYFGFRAGERWGLRAPTTVRIPGSGSEHRDDCLRRAPWTRSSSKTP